MERRGIPGAGRGDRRPGRGAGKRSAAGLKVVERDGFWHVHGTVALRGLDGGRRSVRVRKGTGLPAGPDTLTAAETLRDTWALEIRNQVIHGIRPSRALSLAIEAWLRRPRAPGRKASWREVSFAQEIVRRFRVRLVNEISAEEWASLVEARCEGRSPATRERYLNTVFSFLNWCARKPRQWIENEKLPHFERNAQARKPRHRQRRHVADWRPELILLLIENAGWHLRPQLWTQWSTGQRVSAVLRVRLADAVLAPGREQITFGKTKTGEPVTASLHPRAGEALREYLKKRGRLWDREGPLFLTRSGKPYKTENELSGHNRTAFGAAKRRANAVRRRQAVTQALELRRQGRLEEARAAIGQAWADRKLMRQVTQHWFRHLLATTMMAMGAPLRVGMDQGGWLEVESFMAYAHDVPEVRRAVVDQLPIGAPAKKESA
jgi:site-specific recombinase XerD